jgi:hypothetical protein
MILCAIPSSGTATIFRMLRTLAPTFFLTIGLCHACECSEPSVQQKRDHSDIIFRGTIVELRDRSKPQTLDFYRDTGKTIVFRVSRVWKGDVSETFEMPGFVETTACAGFEQTLLSAKTELLVYADHLTGSVYLTSICGFHKLAKYAKDDFKKLGPGRPPR